MQRKKKENKMSRTHERRMEIVNRTHKHHNKERKVKEVRERSVGTFGRRQHWTIHPKPFRESIIAGR